MTTVLQENLSGVKVVKAFGAQGFEQAKFNARSNAVADLTYAATRVFASQGSLMTFIFTAATGAILWFGGREVAVDRITPGGLASFIPLHGPPRNAHQNERLDGQHRLPRLLGRTAPIRCVGR